MPVIASYLYLISAICFILSIKGLASPASARRGNIFGIAGMFLAIVTTLVYLVEDHHLLIVLAIIIGGAVGSFIAIKIKMTAMPQLVAAFHSLIGLAAVLIASAAIYAPETFNIGSVGMIARANLFELSLGSVVGAITFSGSVIAFLKLQGIMSGTPMMMKGRHVINLIIVAAIFYYGYQMFATGNDRYFLMMTGLAFLLGFLLIIPIGGADMPVIVSMLNSYSGWAAAGIGFSLQNQLLTITGALVGASGAILSYIMCKAMNRSFFSVVLGGFGETDSGEKQAVRSSDRPVKSYSGEDAAYMLSQAKSVIIVPGYGMAVAQAQHAVKELVDQLIDKGIKVRFAIHPVAGRMPGHMNVLLAEANLSYDLVFEQDEINRDFSSTDVAIVIGANDITNPAAKTDKASPIYGMPILNVGDAEHVLFIKRGMAPGYAAIENELFFQDNTYMVFGDAKDVIETILKHVQ